MMKNKIKHTIFIKCACLMIGVFLYGNLHAQVSEDSIKILLNKKVEGVTFDQKTMTNLGNPSPKKERCTLNTVMVGAGSANMYDTYLSPQEYTGYSLRVIDERMRETYWLGGKFRKQQIIEFEFAKGDSPAKNVTEYWARARYQLGGHYELYRNAGLRFSMGGFWDINAGGLYNERNGNNPATGRVYTNLNASVLASYKWKRYSLRWQMDTPFMGMLFSPKYGQSYYEISLGNTVGVVNFASYHNQRSFRNLVTLDIPINKYMVRVGYLGDWYQTKMHSIQTHHYVHSFVLGFPLEGIKRDKEKTQNSYWD